MSLEGKTKEEKLNPVPVNIDLSKIDICYKLKLELHYELEEIRRWIERSNGNYLISAYA